jgi:hypothetical protein
MSFVLGVALSVIFAYSLCLQIQGGSKKNGVEQIKSGQEFLFPADIPLPQGLSVAGSGKLMLQGLRPHGLW